MLKKIIFIVLIIILNSIIVWLSYRLTSTIYEFTNYYTLSYNIVQVLICWIVYFMLIKTSEKEEYTFFNTLAYIYLYSFVFYNLSMIFIFSSVNPDEKLNLFTKIILGIINVLLFLLTFKEMVKSSKEKGLYFIIILVTAYNISNILCHFYNVNNLFDRIIDLLWANK